jgi:uncharacterized protein
MNTRILVSGVSGPIGAALLPSLRGNGTSIMRLVRGRANGEDQISWDPSVPLAPSAVSGFDTVIHLAGESIMGRWTKEKKEKIRDSRVVGTFNLSSALAQADERPNVFICASATGYYGNRRDETLNENSAPGDGFLAETCQDWEEATTPAVQADIRTAHIRTGLVLSPQGGALGAMLTPFKLGLGGRMGSGQQWMSWIHVQDMVGAIHHILKNDLIQGAVNMVAPRPVRNLEFAKTLATVLSRPAIFPLPEFAVKLLFGEMGEEALLASQKVEPAKLISTGYPYRYHDLRAALEALLKM